MARRSNLKLNTKLQQDKPEVHRFNYGGFEDKDDNQERNYLPMINNFRTSLRRLRNDRFGRRAERNAAIRVPAHIDYIQISFQGSFSIEGYNQIYYNEFGLEVVNLTEFNRKVLFSVVDQDKFNSLLGDIKNFILKESGQNDNVDYRGKVKYIRDFKLLTTSDILIYPEHLPLMNFQLTDLPAGSVEWHEIYDSLDQHLNELGLDHRLIEDANLLEVFGATEAHIEEIAKNFDILQSVTSSLATVIRPSGLNIAERTYGFEIENADDDLPIIGIVDTGISGETPLNSLLINDNSFNLTNSSPFVDLADGGYGHGTAVAGLAALGKRPYSQGYAGRIIADAKLLSIKIMDGVTGYISIFGVMNLLKRSKENYPSIKLFVLTICFKQNKRINEAVSSYAYLLDRFAHENDCLVFICTANNNDADRQKGYDFVYFQEEHTTLCSPAESMNNITVGAAADNLQSSGFYGISRGPEWPSLYSRKGNIELERYKKPNKRFSKDNPHLFKPDIITSGGDYEQGPGFIGTGEKATMEVLSADPTRSFVKRVGTSFATPLIANIAAQVQRKYPNLRSQSIKALILNAASSDLIRFEQPYDRLQRQVAGHGLANSERSIYSSENLINFIIEDEIEIKQMKIFPLNFPQYLTSQDLGKKNGILRVTATLCYSFDPEFNNQLAYCPVHMAFAIFRNHSGEDILKSATGSDGIDSKLKTSWSQNNRFKLGPPASNSQKISFVLNIKDLLEENSTLKLAIHCKLSTQLISTHQYERAHPFSIALTIEETLRKGQATGKLYSEMIAVNQVESIIDITTEAEGEIEV